MMGELQFHELIHIKNTRHFVVELSVLIEELVSETLGELLNIEWKSSRSLGLTSSSISFNQKISFIQDLKGLEKLQKEKLDTFMYIRNKFAHVKLIDSFETLRENTSGNKLKNLEKWYSSFEKLDNEKKHRHLFHQLSYDIINILFHLRIQTIYQKGLNTGREEFKDKLLDILKEDVKRSEEANEIWNNAIKKVKKD